MEIRVGPDPEQGAAAWIAHRLRAAHRRRGEALLALSGGSTAPPMIAALLDQDVPWASTTVWQVDERVVPDGDQRRNVGQLDVLPCRIRPMPVTNPDLRRAARQYGAALPDRLDVVHLGVGDDGHTASWPPGAVGVIRSARPVELVPEFNGVPRMTMTNVVVGAARCRVVLTVGPSKRAVVGRWLERDRSLPITAVRSASTWVFLDVEAAPPGLNTTG